MLQLEAVVNVVMNSLVPQKVYSFALSAQTQAAASDDGICLIRSDACRPGHTCLAAV
jgi:hypothetical protein